MAHNKLLRSCMWWGNQGGKWGGNSLLHATLIHPSVRETSPLCTPHLKRPQDDHCRPTVHGTQVWCEVNTGPPCSIWTLRRLPQLLDPRSVDIIAARAKNARCITSLWAEEGKCVSKGGVLDLQHSVLNLTRCCLVFLFLDCTKWL